MNRALIEELRWKKFPVLSDGFVCLVDVMGDDAAVVQAARVSYGKDNRDTNGRHWEKLEKLFPKGGNSTYIGAKGPMYSQEQHNAAIDACHKDDRNLIRYLMAHRHTTPFEMAEVKLLVRVPMDTWRQWIRHRTANVNEYSTRYTEAIDSMDRTDHIDWRAQSSSNKQGSDGKIDFEVGIELSQAELELHNHAKQVYQDRLNAGVAKEQARKDLPLSNYTEAYWKCDLHNTLGFLALRMDSHAQKEIRDYANIIGNEIIAKLFPVTWEAFQDYRMNSITLSGPQIRILQGYNQVMPDREMKDLEQKMERLNYPLDKFLASL